MVLDGGMFAKRGSRIMNMDVGCGYVCIYVSRSIQKGSEKPAGQPLLEP